MSAGICFGLSDEQRELQKLARRFAYEEVRPVARRLDRKGDPGDAYPRGLVRRASELGLRTLTLPCACGGRGADTVTQAAVLEEICVGDAGFGMILLHPWREGLALARLTTNEQRERFLPAFIAEDEYVTSFAMSEPHAGSDHITPYDADLEAGVRTRATLEGDEWVISGCKKWISNGNVSRIVFLLARTNPDVPWRQGVSLFLVPSDAPGFRVGQVEDKLGLRLNQNVELHLEGCRIPRENLVGDVNGGFALLPEFARGSIVMEGVKSLGIARAAYEEAIAWSRDRVQGGGPIFEHQVVRAALSKMATDVEAARALIWRAAWVVDHDSERAPALEAMAKVFAGEIAVRTAISALELHGGYGVVRDNLVEKLVRDAVSMLHAFGGNHAVRERISRSLAARTDRGLSLP